MNKKAERAWAFTSNELRSSPSAVARRLPLLLPFFLLFFFFDSFFFPPPRLDPLDWVFLPRPRPRFGACAMTHRTFNLCSHILQASKQHNIGTSSSESSIVIIIILLSFVALLVSLVALALFFLLLSLLRFLCGMFLGRLLFWGSLVFLLLLFILEL